MTPKRAWRVAHAGDDVRTVFELAQAQAEAGMRPVVVLPEGLLRPEMLLAERAEQCGNHDLLTAWREVRRWRHHLLDLCGFGSDLIHAHCFAAGMAAVREFPIVVYEIGRFVEDPLGERPSPWMARSFRVAEMFVIARAAAIVVHAPEMLEAAYERGARRQDVFVIPELAQGPPPAIVRSYDAVYRHAEKQRSHHRGRWTGMGLQPTRTAA